MIRKPKDKVKIFSINKKSGSLAVTIPLQLARAMQLQPGEVLSYRIGKEGELVYFKK